MQALSNSRFTRPSEPERLGTKAQSRVTAIIVLSLLLVPMRMDPYRVPLKPATLELTQVSPHLGGTIPGQFKFNTSAFAAEKKP